MLSLKQTDKKRHPTNSQTKRPARVESRETKLQQEKSTKTLRSKESNKKASSARVNSNIVVSNRNKNTKPNEVHEKLVVLEEVSRNSKTLQVNNQESIYRHNKHSIELNEELNESDSETVTDSVSSSGDSRVTEHDLQINNISKKINNESKGLKIHPKPPSTPSSISSEGFDGPVGILDEASNGVQSDDEMFDTEENIELEVREDLNLKIAQMEMKIEKLENELREVAALEISLYSVVQEHASSAHKVHTPAHRLSKLYIHASKHFSQEKRATIAKNIVSGLVMISMSCGNGVPRLTFWLSNIIALREIITQVFGNKQDFNEFVDDWKETRTFTSELEKVESEIFSLIVESIWSQTLTPNMLTNVTSGEQQWTDFSINLWQNAFDDAFKRLCPIRSRGHECGCLTVLARMVMEHCVSRLDVAMFNAIVLESAHETLTDSVSDPITEFRVLPIPAGDLSFGSGAQLKKAVGNWSRWLDDRFSCEIKWFNLLNSLSHLLMVPKDMIMDKLIRAEICPSISLPLLKRILSNFTPDEFCPDPVPNTVLEAINAESIIECRSSEENSSIFPYAAATIIYKPPCSIDVSEKVFLATSHKELEETDFCPNFIIEKLPDVNGNIASYVGSNARYELLREVWSS